MRGSEDSDVMPECYIDTNLVKTLLGVTGHKVNHKKGCNNVTKSMDTRYKDRFAFMIKLRKETKNVNVDDDDRFRRLFKDIKDAKEMKILVEIMGYLLENKYSAVTETLKSFFDIPR